jgi:ubiquinone biosynthesis protein
MDEATRNGLVLAPETVAALTVADRRARRGQTAALWVIAALLAGLLILALR